jgi:hypothetical protein
MEPIKITMVWVEPTRDPDLCSLSVNHILMAAKEGMVHLAYSDPEVGYYILASGDIADVLENDTDDATVDMIRDYFNGETEVDSLILPDSRPAILVQR